MTTSLSELRNGRYALVRKLGAGSQGETYEAIDRGTGPAARRTAPLAEQWARYVREQKTGGDIPQDAKLVAIKCFRVRTATSWKEVELAEREARTLAALDHPRLPKYFEHFEEDGALYLVMEKIEGESLATLRKEQRVLAVTDVVRMLDDVGSALRYLHGLAPQVVHRDIKPGNVLRRPDGSFALVDFGAVRDRLKPAGGSTVVGTFGYMAPEQFQNRTSSASDVYGLGATALTMLTGVEPEDLPHVGLGIDVDKALRSGTPPALVRALKAMLVPDPDARARSMDEVLAILHPAPKPAASARIELPAPRSQGNEELPVAPARRRPLRVVDVAVIVLTWTAVWFVSRGGHGHHPMQTGAAIVFAIMVTSWVRRARWSAQANVRVRQDQERAAAGAQQKIRVGEAPPRVRAAPVQDADDDEPSDEHAASSDRDEEQRGARRIHRDDRDGR